MPTPDMKGKHIVIQWYSTPATCLPFKRCVWARQYGEFETLAEWTTDDPADTTVKNAVAECTSAGAAKVEVYPNN